jgi:AcrR family transcriptional regulator
MAAEKTQQSRKAPSADTQTSPGGDEDISWQAQKSAMTRDRILDAAINCFINLGYTNVTTAKVASTAGVSRGAMLHHFPSKTELIQAAVEYLHGKLLEDYTERVNAIPSTKKGKAHRRAGLDAYWDHLTGDLATAYHELCVAGRTDPELKQILLSSSARFAEHVHKTNAVLFKEWNDRGDRYLLAMDVTRFMMEGMALGQLTVDRKERIPLLLDYLADRLEEIFKEGKSSAIGRHSA